MSPHYQTRTGGEGPAGSWGSDAYYEWFLGLSVPEEISNGG